MQSNNMPLHCFKTIYYTHKCIKFIHVYKIAIAKMHIYDIIYEELTWSSTFDNMNLIH